MDDKELAEQAASRARSAADQADDLARGLAVDKVTALAVAVRDARLALQYLEQLRNRRTP